MRTLPPNIPGLTRRGVLLQVQMCQMRLTVLLQKVLRGAH